MDEFRILQFRASAGDPESMAHLGLCYYLGQGVDVDYKAAENFLKGSAAKGNMAGNFIYGCFLEEIRKDRSAAIKYYEKAAELGHPESQRRTADLYAIGVSPDPDQQKAAFWYLKAAENGVPEAQFVLGESYRTGILMRKNEQLAFTWYEKAAEGGYHPARVRLEQYYPEGVPQAGAKIVGPEIDDPKSTLLGSNVFFPEKLFAFLEDRPENVNSTLIGIARDMIVRSAVREGIVPDVDLANVLELTPTLIELAGHLRDDLIANGQREEDSEERQIIDKYFCYAFAKGAEAAYLWNESSDGKVEFSCVLDDARKGSVGAQVDYEFSQKITSGMRKAWNVFIEYRAGVSANPTFCSEAGRKLLSDMIAMGFFWASQVGLDFGLNVLGFKSHPGS